MIICTFIYEEIAGTREMKRSIERHGHELAIIPVSNISPDAINNEMYNFYKRASTGHKKFVYTDSADTFLQRPITEDEIPSESILYSTEKNCYPYPEWADKFPDPGHPYRYLNGGGVCGSIQVMIAYHEKYKLASVGGMNGQAYLQQCYLQAKEDGFAIDLDTDCKIFQTLAFSNDKELGWRPGKTRMIHQERGAPSVDDSPLLYNKLTGTTPALLHGNGLTEMKHIYEKWK